MKWRFIRIFCTIGLLALAWWRGASHAAEAVKHSGIEGSWRWNYTNADSGVIQPTLRVWRETDGTLSGTSRFRPGTSTTVTNLSFNGEQVSFEVVRTRDGESIVTRYLGAFQGDQIKGQVLASSAGEQWTSEWNAERFSDIDGVWKWRLGAAPSGARRGGGEEITLTIKREQGDRVSGKIKLGPSSGHAEHEIHQARYQDNNLSFETVRTRADGGMSTNFYWGNFARGAIAGKFTTDFGGIHRTNEWRAVRAE